MKISPRPRPHQNSTSHCSHSGTANSTTTGNASPPPQQPKIMSRSESATNPYPTTFVQADTSSFKQVVQMLTGSKQISTPDPISKAHNIPPIKTIPKRQQQSSFKLYERRNNALIHSLHINPGFSSRNFPEILSPSMLDFPSLVLSPVTPLIPDPFARSQPLNSESESSSNHPAVMDEEAAEAKAIREKGFYLHPSPSTTPRESQPQLLPLFPIASPPQPGCSSSTSS